MNIYIYILHYLLKTAGYIDPHVYKTGFSYLYKVLQL